MSVPHTRLPMDRLEALVQEIRAPGVLESTLLDEWRGWSPQLPSRLSVEVIQTHYRPFSRARLVARATVRPTGGAKKERLYLYIQVHPSRESFESRLQSALQVPWIPSYGPGIFGIRKWNAVVFVLPNGPRLRKGSKLVHHKKLRKFLFRAGLVDDRESIRRGQVSLIRYVPRKRMLIRCAEAPTGGVRSNLYLKLYNSEAWTDALHHVRPVASLDTEQIRDLRLPRFLGEIQQKRCMVMTEVPGAPLSGRYHDADMVRVGQALSTLHELELPGIPFWSLMNECRSLQVAVTDLARAAPESASGLSAFVHEQLQRAPVFEGREQRTIHGNLFGDQILLHDRGVGLVDWDDVALGDPGYDLGRLLAHTAFVAAKEKADWFGNRASELIDSYRISSPQTLQENRLRWHLASALVMRVKISALRPLTADWPDALDWSVRQAVELMSSPAAVEDWAQALDPTMGWES